MEKKDNAMKLLRLIWGYIAKKPKKEIDDILRGPRDVVMQDDKEPVSLEKKEQRTRLEVEALIHPAYRERKNKDGLTPYELSIKEHKDLVDQGEKWLRDMANHCMVIDCLITAMVFAVAYTFPGGYRQTKDKYNGLPVFLSKPSFFVFVLADVVSFLLSCASIAIFSSINTSRFAERDFLQTLPKELMFGLGTLVLSMMMLTIAFSVSFFVCYAKKGFLAMSIIIVVVAGLVVLLFIRLHYRLIYDVGQSSFGSRYHFKPKKTIFLLQKPYGVSIVIFLLGERVLIVKMLYLCDYGKYCN
ncbi:putative PGG domain-containing protein [Helianthus debilis subsp. tardiflorus]